LSSNTKLHLKSGIFCALLMSLNWSSSVQYSRKIGVISESFSPAGLALVISGLAALCLVVSCVCMAKAMLECGGRVRPGRWVRDPSVLLYALPLLFERHTTSTWAEPDGAIASKTGGYGSSFSTWIFLFTVLGLVLFQVFSKLCNGEEKPNHPTEPTSAPVTAAAEHPPRQP